MLLTLTQALCRAPHLIILFFGASSISMSTHHSVVSLFASLVGSGLTSSLLGTEKSWQSVELTLNNLGALVPSAVSGCIWVSSCLYICTKQSNIRQVVLVFVPFVVNLEGLPKRAILR